MQYKSLTIKISKKMRLTTAHKKELAARECNEQEVLTIIFLTTILDMKFGDVSDRTLYVADKEGVKDVLFVGITKEDNQMAFMDRNGDIVFADEAFTNDGEAIITCILLNNIDNIDEIKAYFEGKYHGLFIRQLCSTNLAEVIRIQEEMDETEEIVRLIDRFILTHC